MKKNSVHRTFSWFVIVTLMFFGIHYVFEINKQSQVISLASQEPDDHNHEETDSDSHEDHGHEHAEDSISHTAWSEHIEWFIELARPEPNHSAQFAAHVTLLEDFSPAMQGDFDVIATQGTQKVETHAHSPSRPGIFTPSITIPSTGIWKLTITYSSGKLEESIQYEIEVFEAGEAPAEEEGDGGISLLKEQQWNLPFQTAWAKNRELAEYLPVYGSIVPRPVGHAQIIAPIAGRFSPADGDDGIQPGTMVQANEVIGFIEPQYTGPEMTAQLLNRSELISSRVQVERDLAQSRQQMEKAKKELERTRSLYKQKAKSQRELEQAELDYRLAKESFDSAQRLLSQLNESKDAVSKGQFPIISPIQGTISHMEAVAGSYIETNGELFEIIDLSTVWVDAHVYEQDISLLQNDIHAYVTTPTYPDQFFECNHLVHIGAKLEQGTRTLPVKYEIANSNKKLKVGMAVTVYLEIKPIANVLSIPQKAVVDENARSVVYVQLDGETFEKRVVTLGRKDRGMVEVVNGLEPGERIVTEGAHFVRLASLQTQMGGGHGHPH